MSNRKKILAVFLLSLIILAGGGFLYFSLLTQRFVIGETESLAYVYNPEQVVIPRVNLGNVNTKKVRRSKIDNDGMTVPDAGRKLPSEGTVGGIGSFSSGTKSGFSGYSYGKRAIESTNSGGGGNGGGGMLAYGGGGSRSGSDNVSGGYSGGTMMGGTSPMLVPRTPTSTPPTAGGGVILVDPMSDPLESDRLPVGDGWWILMILALGYGLKSKKEQLKKTDLYVKPVNRDDRDPTLSRLLLLPYLLRQNRDYLP